MRGEKESCCFNKVKTALFYKDKQPVYNPLDGKSAFTVDDTAFKANYRMYCNSDFQHNYFGLSDDERAEFANAIRTAKPNPSSSEFPDFVFSNGFIEHFQITSSKTTRKGATHTREESNFHRKVDAETKKLAEEWNKTPCFDEERSRSWSFDNPVHSYVFLKDSFKSHWKNHIESKQKYAGEKTVGIFMIDYPESALAMRELVYCPEMAGKAWGDMREQEKFKEYRLSRDQELLKYIYDFRTEIKYVVFVNYNRIEVIRTESIPYLLSLIPWKYQIYTLITHTTSTLHSVSIPFNATVGDDESDKT